MSHSDTAHFPSRLLFIVVITLQGLEGGCQVAEIYSRFIPVFASVLCAYDIKPHDQFVCLYLAVIKMKIEFL